MHLPRGCSVDFGFSPTSAAIENADAFDDKEGRSSPSVFAWSMVGDGEGRGDGDEGMGDGDLLRDDSGDEIMFGESIVRI